MAAVFDFLRAITKYWFRIKNGISWGTFWFQIGEYERVNGGLPSCVLKILFNSWEVSPWKSSRCLIQRELYQTDNCGWWCIEYSLQLGHMCPTCEPSLYPSLYQHLLVGGRGCLPLHAPLGFPTDGESHCPAKTWVVEYDMEMDDSISLDRDQCQPLAGKLLDSRAYNWSSYKPWWKVVGRKTT